MEKEDESVHLLTQQLILELVQMMVVPENRAVILTHPQYPDLAALGPSLSGVGPYSNMP